MYRVGVVSCDMCVGVGSLITRKDEKYLNFMVVIVGSNTLYIDGDSKEYSYTCFVSLISWKVDTIYPP